LKDLAHRHRHAQAGDREIVARSRSSGIPIRLARAAARRNEKGSAAANAQWYLVTSTPTV